MFYYTIYIYCTEIQLSFCNYMNGALHKKGWSKPEYPGKPATASPRPWSSPPLSFRLSQSASSGVAEETDAEWHSLRHFPAGEGGRRSVSMELCLPAGRFLLLQA